MMRFLTAGLGVLTILTVTSAMTPSGQAMLGIRPSPNQAPVTVISDPGPALVAPAAPAPRPAPVAPAAVHPPAPAPATTARPVAHPAPAAPAARPSTPASGLGQITNVANILLNLPQVLSRTQVQPAPGGPQLLPKERKHHPGEPDDETPEHH